MKYYRAMSIMLCAAVLFIDCGRGRESSERGSVIRVAVNVAQARQRTLRHTRAFSGVLDPLRKADLAPLTPGKVKQIRVNIGDRVAKGQLLVYMDDVSLVSTAAQFQPLKAQYDRAHRLFASKAMSRVQFEEIEARYLAMKRQLDQIEENTTIKAPFAGVIIDKTVEEGEIYSMGIPAGPGRSGGILQLAQLNPLKVDIDIDEETVRRVRKGQNVEITVDAFPDTVFAGTVDWVNPAANKMSRTFGVRILVSNTKEVLQPGFFIQAHIVLEEKQDVLAVPDEAVLGNKLFVVTDSMAVAKQVRTGWSAGGYTEIIEGIDTGAVVVVSGNRALPDSAMVEVRE